jgi:hypothetical protein
MTHASLYSPPGVSVAKLIKAHRNFINHFISQDFTNATEAYLKAYPSASYETARVESSRLLARPNIQELLATTLTDILAKEKVPLEKRIFDYWVKRAFYDITEIIDLSGNLIISLESLREKGLTVCIDSINKKVDAQGNETVVYKFADKDKAVEMLQKYIQMIHETIDVKVIPDETRLTLRALFHGESAP